MACLAHTRLSLHVLLLELGAASAPHSLLLGSTPLMPECPINTNLRSCTTSHPLATPSFLYLKLWTPGESAGDSTIGTNLAPSSCFSRSDTGSLGCRNPTQSCV